MGLVEMADTQERAQRALKLLAKNFQNRRDELPPDWQYVHVLLTERAGEAEEAAKAWDEYVTGWGDDPHLLSLWQIKMAQAQAATDDKGVAEVFGKIIAFFSEPLLGEPGVLRNNPFPRPSEVDLADVKIQFSLVG